MKIIGATILYLVFTCQMFAQTKNAVTRSVSETNQISFTENRGQVHDQNEQLREDILFGGSDGKLAFHMRKDGISYQLNNRKPVNYNLPFEAGVQQKFPAPTEPGLTYRVDLSWAGCNKNPAIIAGEPSGSITNFYTSGCPYGVLNVRSYNEVTYKNIYQGIDVHWYSKDGSLKYDYLLSSGASYTQIRLKVEGAENIQVDPQGKLIINTPLGKITEEAPLVMQEGKALSAKWMVKENTISFYIPDADASRPLIIDPAVRIWGTYYGATGTDMGLACATDPAGNIYMAGHTDAVTNTIIATTGSHQSTNGGGTLDTYVVKFNSSGVRQWGTYYGGNDTDWFGDCAVDNNGNVYMSGYTKSTNASAISTATCHQPLHGGGDWDCFLVKLNAFGVRQWGTYYGGTADDYAYSCAVDLVGNVYMNGNTSTNTGTVIATPGSHLATMTSPVAAFLVKFNTNGVRQWGTYYGDMGYIYATCCTADNFGNVFLCGSTQSSTGTVIATPGSFQPVTTQQADAFIVKFNGAGVRKWGTYYGGTGWETGGSCTTDSKGNVFLATLTASATVAMGTVMVTPGCHQFTPSGIFDCVLAKLDSNGTRLWATYYGGGSTTNSINFPRNIAVDKFDNIFLAGQTNASNGIATPNGNQTTFAGGQNDGFLAKFNSSGVRQWGTYYGGTQEDIAFDCAAGANGEVYLTGYSISNTGTAIATPGSHQPVMLASIAPDAFLVKIYDCTPNSYAAPQIVCSTQGATLSVNAGTSSVTWYPSSASNQSVGNGTTMVTSNLAAGAYTYFAESSGCISGTNRVGVTFTVAACTSLSENQLQTHSFAIYPNPFNDELFVKSSASAALEITNALGQIIGTFRLVEGLNTLPVQNLPAGIYFAKCESDNQSGIIKLVK